MPSPDADNPNQPRIVVAGLGLLTPLGHAAWPTFAALLDGRTLASRAERAGEPDAMPTDFAGVELVRSLGAVSIAQQSAADPAVELAERAGREALFETGVEPGGVPAFLGTSKGAVRAMTEACGHFLSNEPAARLAEAAPAVTLGAHGYLTEQLQQRLGVTCVRHVVAACASSLTALDAARLHLLHSRAAGEASPYALVLTADAALLPAFVHSYRRLGVLSPLNVREYRQRPLDARRTGFMLSEAGAAVLLKRLGSGEAPKLGEIELVDTAVAAETHDLIRPSRDMPALQHVAGRLFGRRRIDVLHPHAPGTLDHDPIELNAYARTLDATGRRYGRPELYACKGALGHSLGAAGLTAFVLACLSLRSGRRPPMPWLNEPMTDAHGFRLTAEAGPCARTGTHAVLAAGFAGHVAGAVIQRR
ncbi:MAG: beta-ketoacyl synthase N-terminal-like domain-containing protein [Phycisphaeraceae bacterium]